MLNIRNRSTNHFNALSTGPNSTEQQEWPLGDNTCPVGGNASSVSQQSTAGVAIGRQQHLSCWWECSFCQSAKNSRNGHRATSLVLLVGMLPLSVSREQQEWPLGDNNTCPVDGSASSVSQQRTAGMAIRRQEHLSCW